MSIPTSLGELSQFVGVLAAGLLLIFMVLVGTQHLGESSATARSLD